MGIRMKNILIGVPDPVGTDPTEAKSGIYVVPVEDAYSVHPAPIVVLTNMQDERRTPRLIKSGEPGTFVLTRDTLTQMSVSPTIGTQRSEDLERLLVAHREKCEGIMGAKDIAGSIDFVKGVGGRVNTFLAVYRADELGQPTQPGSLFRTEGNPLTSGTLELIEGYSPSGPLVTTEDNSLGVSEGINLRWYGSETTITHPGDAEAQQHVRLVTANHLNGLTLCSYTDESYLLNNGKFNFHATQDIVGILQGTNTASLPSLATSVLLIRHKATHYALFGVDNAALVVYEVQSGEEIRKPEVKRLKLVSFLSMEGTFARGQQSYIKNLSYHNGDLSFTLRNLYLRMGFDEVLNLPEETRMGIEEEQNHRRGIERPEYRQYLARLIDRYRLKQVCAVPHRIVTVEHVRN